MGRKKQTDNDEVDELRPMLTPQAQESRMINLAIKCAEKQLLDGTASSQVITHYLKLASEKERLENELLEKKVALAAAKTEAIESEKHIEELYENAINAMRRYGGHGED